MTGLNNALCTWKNRIFFVGDDAREGEALPQQSNEVIGTQAICTSHGCARGELRDPPRNKVSSTHLELRLLSRARGWHTWKNRE